LGTLWGAQNEREELGEDYGGLSRREGVMKRRFRRGEWKRKRRRVREEMGMRQRDLEGVKGVLNETRGNEFKFDKEGLRGNAHRSRGMRVHLVMSMQT